MTVNTQQGMLALQFLLNPDTPGHGVQAPAQVQEVPVHSNCPPAMPIAAAEAATVKPNGPLVARTKRHRDVNSASKSGPRGPINYPPHEDVDESTAREVSRFQVTPFGQIHKFFGHFPYNSEKRDLLDKTGRESIEAFTYEFRVPGSNSVHVVMWDYNIGIVRLASIFRLCGFNKTGPAQTFNKNPGLQEITPNITGGAVPAQGYWFPYHCAKAICAKFCYNIAAALIPVFGPDFPAECIPPESPLYRRLEISKQVLAKSAELCAKDRITHTIEPTSSYVSTERLSHARPERNKQMNEPQYDVKLPPSQAYEIHGQVERALLMGSPGFPEYHPAAISSPIPRNLAGFARRDLRSDGCWDSGYPGAVGNRHTKSRKTSSKRRRPSGAETVPTTRAWEMEARKADSQELERHGKKARSDLDHYGAATILANLRTGFSSPGSFAGVAGPFDGMRGCQPLVSHRM
ncbi:hypothetical protein B0I35DRAFT_403559 [Stachybotrys elegans]|uniref:HTH APSES-type domain-containing protein n=1 Tax=Stachybotrys elegans TaxID=80388 RepID=A0A8K0WXS4_9HYPO|nr:hypothetical protein B0I35DRAFT_403559 [Stachybotrys elegans]